MKDHDQSTGDDLILGAADLGRAVWQRTAANRGERPTPPSRVGGASVPARFAADRPVLRRRNSRPPRAGGAHKRIEKLMRDAGLNYVSLVELGNLFVDLEDWERRYTDLLKAAGPYLIERLVGLPTPSCLLCCEKDPVHCHRRLIAEYMAGRGWIIEHIL